MVKVNVTEITIDTCYKLCQYSIKIKVKTFILYESVTVHVTFLFLYRFFKTVIAKKNAPLQTRRKIISSK